MESNVFSFATILRRGIKSGGSILDQEVLSRVNSSLSIILAYLPVKQFSVCAIGFTVLMLVNESKLNKNITSEPGAWPRKSYESVQA